MDLNKDNIKKIKGLILFTILVLVLLWNYKLIFSAIGFLWKVILPFVIGGAIAFVLSVPMNFFERKIF
jgi:predicted PurR-regulated permease PerM